MNPNQQKTQFVHEILTNTVISTYRHTLVSLVLGANRKGDVMFSIEIKDAYFTFSST